MVVRSAAVQALQVLHGPQTCCGSTAALELWPRTICSPKVTIPRGIACIGGKIGRSTSTTAAGCPPAWWEINPSFSDSFPRSTVATPWERQRGGESWQLVRAFSLRVRAFGLRCLGLWIPCGPLSLRQSVTLPIEHCSALEAQYNGDFQNRSRIHAQAFGPKHS